MGLDLNALQNVMSKVNSTTLNAAMTAYFNGSANATQAFAMLDPAAAAAITEMLNGTDLSSFVGMTAKPKVNTTDGTTLTPSPVMPVSIPPLPRPGIFDAPSNPYLNGLDTGSGALSSLMGGLSPEAQAQAQLVLVNEMVKAAKKKAYEISLLLLLGYLLVLIFNVVLIIHIRYNRHLATKGNATAARKIVLPAFEPLLWTYTVILVAYIIFWSATIRADFMTVQSTFVTIEMAYGCKQVLYLLVPIFMMQKSLSVPALVRAIAITVAASYYTVPIVWAMQQYGKPGHPHQLVYYWIMWTSRWLTFLPFLYVCIWPPARASAQAFREYFMFYLVVQCLYFSACEIFHQGGSIDLGTKFGWASAVWVGLCPYVIWRVLKADTEHWRGIGKRAVELQTLFRRNGLVEERISAKGLHVLIEMHRKFIIDFANLDIQHKIGEGTNSIVFRGRLNAKQTPVAIKVFTPANVNEDTVAEFSHEAALCGALQHPNILKFYGMCVCPPTISFVHELCQGSLQDITRAMAKRSVVNPHRQQFLINIAYMIDAARAVAYLHSFSPPYVHRDIHPSSFLVDAEGFVKLTDFGASRTLSVRNTPVSVVPAQTTTVILNREGPQTVLSSTPAAAASVPTQTSTRHEAAPQTIKRLPEYMAPEVIRSKNAGASMYGEAADIYALAITMWDILYPTTPKYAPGSVATATSTSASSDAQPSRDSYNQRESDVFDRVFAGHRPVLDDHVYPPLKHIIMSAWHPDPRVRPKAVQIVQALERIQQETSAVYASELMDELECGQHNKTPLSSKRHVSLDIGSGVLSFQGARAIERMYALQHVAAEFEAVRLGNMLMDAGLLHHMKHLRSFEYSAALYFFDEDSIQLHQPLAMLEDGSGGVVTPGDATASGNRRGGGGVATRSTHRGKASLGSVGAQKASRLARHSHASSDNDAFMENGTGFTCACRKLGQKSETAQTTRSRLRLKFKSNDENLLTARLLADEPNGDFEAFQDAHARDIQVSGSQA